MGITPSVLGGGSCGLSLRATLYSSAFKVRVALEEPIDKKILGQQYPSGFVWAELELTGSLFQK